MIQVPGFPAARIQMARKFAEVDGFRVILNLVKDPQLPWLGANKIQIVVKSMIEVGKMHLR